MEENYFVGYPGKITQRFGNTNWKLYKDVGGKNRGVDIKMDVGTPIIAPRGMKVISTKTSGWNTGWGKNILVKDYQTGEMFRFSHLSDVNVKPGDTLTEGQLIGRSGQSGRITGPHLDIEYFNSEGKLADVEKAYPAWFNKTEQAKKKAKYYLDKVMQGVDLSNFNLVGQVGATGASPVGTPQRPNVMQASQQLGVGVQPYTVKAGDTLWDIAQRTLGSGYKWQQLGYQGDPRKMPIGTQLKIPSPSIASNYQPTPRPVGTPQRKIPMSSATNPAAMNYRPQSGRTYTVKPGDTPGQIAQNLLGDWNKWKQVWSGDPTKMPVGTKVKY